jgi:endonuclease YncB( thermonuclease family)
LVRIPRGLRRRHLVAALLASAIATGVESCRQRGSTGDGPWLVVAVQDGDTVSAKAPDGVQPHGRQARDALATQVGGRQVMVESHGLDQHGRLLARLLVEGRDVNASLVRDGHAWAFGRVAPDPALVAAEAEARRGRRGLWADERPLDPADWRQSHPRQP